jgi:hypothetical protein
MATAPTGVMAQLVSLFSYEGIVGICQGILESPLAVVLIIALIVKSCASTPVKEIEGSNNEVHVCLTYCFVCEMLARVWKFDIVLHYSRISRSRYQLC